MSISPEFLVNYFPGRRPITNVKVDRWLSLVMFQEKLYVKKQCEYFFYIYPPRSCMNTWNHVRLALRKRWYQIQFTRRVFGITFMRYPQHRKINKLFDNAQLRIKLYWPQNEQTQSTMPKYFWNNKRISGRMTVILTR